MDAWRIMLHSAFIEMTFRNLPSILITLSLSKNNGSNLLDFGNPLSR